MKWIFIFVVVAFAGCKKKTETNSFHVLQYTYADVWATVGIEYEKAYWCNYKGKGDTLIFHSNNTVTEKYGSKVITFPVTSYAVDTMQKTPLSPNPEYYYRSTYIMYNKLETTVLDNGSFRAALSDNIAKVTPVYNKSVTIAQHTFTTN